MKVNYTLWSSGCSVTVYGDAVTLGKILEEPPSNFLGTL